MVAIIFCNSSHAMKRSREGEMQEKVALACVVNPVNDNCVQAIVLPPIPPKLYWDEKSPYDGSKVIKATIDHDCKQCNKRIIGVSIAQHAVEKHAHIYLMPSQQTKKVKLEHDEQADNSKKIEILLLSSSECSSSTSGSSSESSSFSDSSSDSSVLSRSSSDSSEDEADNKSRFVTKVLKSGHTVQHPVCDINGCKFSTARSEVMDNHKKLHDVDGCSVCKKCHFRSDIHRVFENHLQTHLPKAKRSNRVQCKVCNRWLSKDSSLQRHMASRHF